MRFSVVIPAYNREHELPKCIESVLNQTFQDFELIIVDNGSTDNTKILVEKYSKDDQRIKYLWQENSGSPAGSRNTGIKNSQGEWIAFLDSDDYWYSQKLEEVDLILQKATEDIIAVSHWEQKEVNGNVDIVLEHGMPCDDFYSQLLYTGNCLSTSAMTVKKDVLIQVGLFDERKEYFAVEDYDLWLKLAKVGKLAFIEKVLGAFCIGNGNMSSNIELMNNNLSEVVKNHIKSLGFSPIKEKYLLRKHLSKIESYRGRAYQLNGEYNKAIPILVHSILEYPFFLRKWGYLLLALIKAKK